jgi:teichoic acid transport system permease protein
VTTASSPDQPSAGELAAVAKAHGLYPLGVRPGFLRYLRQLVSRRSFLWHLARSKSASRHQNTYLGQFWLILNPILLAGVYYLVFGVLIDTTRGVENFPAFLVIGVFIYLFIAKTATAAGDSILGNAPLIRALQFPRAVLPLQVVVSEAITLMPALGVMLAITLATGETPTWSWLLIPLALFVVIIFNAGLAFLVARAVQVTRDLKNVLPLIVQLMRYVSGVFFSVAVYTEDLDARLAAAFEYQPIAVYLTLFRSLLLDEIAVEPSMWLVGIGWAIALFVIGLVVFWRAEDRYGRD